MQDESVVRFLLQALAIVVGGGTVQLVIQLTRRRSELRKVNSESDSVVVAAANNQVVRLEAELQRVSNDCAQVRTDLDNERSRRVADIAEMQRRNTQALADAQERSNEVIEEFRRENVKLNKMVSRLQLDLSRANAEISTLKDRGA
jgi:tRNA A37 N6-isopentenylltransferase MiaA